MKNYKCNNEQCENKDVIIKHHVMTFKGRKDKNNESIPEESVCIKCGEIMEWVNEDEYKDGWKDVMIGTPIGSYTKNWNKPLRNNEKPVY